MLVSGFFDYFCRSHANELCVKQNNHSLSYSAFELYVSKVANALVTNGIISGDRVAVLSTNAIEPLVIFYACSRIGAVYLPLNFRLAAGELNYILGDSGAKLVFVAGQELSDIVDSAALGYEKVFIGESTRAGYTSWQDFIDSPVVTNKAIATAKADQTVYQMYTSGTTGKPKGVMISHRQLCAFISSYSVMPPRLSTQKPHLAVAPMFHAASFSLIIAAISVGRPVVLMDSFDPNGVLNIIEKDSIADTLLVPAMLNAVVAAAATSNANLESLECIVYGGSSISASQLQKAVQEMQCDFQQGFGMTEMVTGAIWLSPDDHKLALKSKPDILSSCGKPAPFIEMKIVDPSSKHALLEGEVGEIWLRGEQMMQGYWQQPEQTTEALLGGWYHTGDAGYIDREGYLYIKDRIKDMIISGGENIYSAEVENVLVAHKDITEVAVIGLPDETYGEAVVAICVTAAKEIPQTEALIAFCRDNIAGYKIPRRYEFLDSLPRNASGKILKRLLKEKFS